MHFLEYWTFNNKKNQLLSVAALFPALPNTKQWAINSFPLKTQICNKRRFEYNTCLPVEGGGVVKCTGESLQ